MKSDTIIAGLVVLAALLLLGFHLTTTNGEYSRDNPDWNGTSEFFSLPDRHTTSDLTGFSALAGRVNATLLLIAPEKGYTDAEVQEIQRFVGAGNTLILASDDDTGNQLLRKMGSPVTINPGVLASIDRAYNESYVVVTTPETYHPLNLNVSSLVLDQAGTVTGGRSLFQSSIMSWIDTDGNHRISGDESIGRRSVASVWSLGAGEVIVIADPSIFINAMLNVGDQWGNRVFMNNLISLHPSLIIEQIESRTRILGGPSWILYQIRTIDIIGIGLIAITLLFIAFLMHRVRRTKSDLMIDFMTGGAEGNPGDILSASEATDPGEG